MLVARKAENLLREISGGGWKPVKMNREEATSEPKHHLGLDDEKERRHSKNDNRNL
jgi:hypothetical protein